MKQSRPFPITLGIAIAVILTGCNVDSAEPGTAENPAGVCSHHYVEPVLNIAYAQDGLSGAPVSRIRIRNVTVDGRLLVDLNTSLVNTKNVREDKGTLVCDIPCGFGTEEGAYQMYVDADGYQTQSVNVRANYRVYSGGCPSQSDQGLHIGITMER